MSPANGKNKVGCLSQASLFSLVLCLWVRPGAYAIVQHPKGLHSGSLKRRAVDKQSSLLQTFLNYICRKFYNNRPRCQCYLTLCLLHRQNKLVLVACKPFQPNLFVGKARSLAYGRVPTRYFSPVPGRNTSLLKTFLNYGLKKFYNIGPRLNKKRFKRFFIEY
jgi:hypothetical protein